MTSATSNSTHPKQKTGISQELPDAGDSDDFCSRLKTVSDQTWGSGVQSQAAGDGGDLNLEENKRASISPINSSSLGSVDDLNDYTDETDGISTPHTHISESNPENKTNLIVNYLPQNLSQEDVRSLFASIGEVENCKLVREKLTGESLGYAFVKYYDAADAEKAIEKINGLKLENKTIKVSVARPSCEAIKGANLYICGLPRTMKTNELENIFKSCGHIITTRILCDKKTSASRGVAFIRYDQRSEAENAIKKFNGYIFPETNDIMMVKFANLPSSQSDGRRSLSSRSTTTSSGQRRRKKSPSTSKVPQLRQSKYCDTGDLESLQAKPQMPLPNMFQPNGPQFYDFGHHGLAPFYSMQPTQGMAMPQVGIYGNEYTLQPTLGNPRLVQQPLWQGAQMGLCRLPNWGYFQHPVPLSKFKQSPPQRGVIATGVPLPYSVGYAPSCHVQTTCQQSGNLCGETELSSTVSALLAPAFAANGGALTTNGWCIFVYNLSADTEDAVLWQLFGPFGAVNAAKVVTDPITGKRKGYGFVTMSNYDEAVKAIQALSGFNLDNRILQVSFKTTTKMNEPARQNCRTFNTGHGGNVNNGGTHNPKRRVRHQVV
ncbi:unnamed protein product [Mesocestoides corti]|uniref:ELAV-like protein 2 n=1 Tax=Mesocestoides corti TaxID=53468 RepID=A0A0R3U3R0_MESCO|nr:unnamed protein product [Mesocestoides corti]